MRRLALIPLALLGALLGCGGVSDDTGVEITIQGQYQDLDPATGTTTSKPMRYAYAELVDAGSGQSFATGYLGTDGRAFGTVESGRRFYLRLSAVVDVPNAAANATVLRGSVRNGVRPSSVANLAAFDATAPVTVISDTTSVSNPGTLSLTATHDTQRRAAAFNAADQMVTYALGVRTAEPSLKLPDLAAYFTPSGSWSNSTETPAVVALDAGGRFQKNGRAVFSFQVAGNNSGAANTNDDLNDDGELLQAYAHQLFAPYSYPETGAQATAVLRNDTDNGYNDRSVQSEASLAFQDGFCDFLSGAFRQLNGDASSHLLQDAWVNGSGQLVVSAFNLTRHDQFTRVAGQGEFYRGSVAISLWQGWNLAQGGTTNGFYNLWDAALANQSGEYLNSPYACYPTYLVGLRRILGSSSVAWNNTLSQLALEDVPNPDAAYFAGTALWTDQNIAFTVNGAFPTYASGIAFDRDQAKATRFVHGGGTRTLTLSSGSPGLVLELFDNVGLLRQTASTSTTNGVITDTLPAGTYVVKVRVDPYVTYANGTASWTLTVN